MSAYQKVSPGLFAKDESGGDIEYCNTQYCNDQFGTEKYCTSTLRGLV